MEPGHLGRGQPLCYRLRFAERRTLSISVLPDGTVEVVAPIATPVSTIEERLIARGAWISRQQEFFGQFVPRVPARSFVGGESHLYLGRQYRLKLEAAATEDVRLHGGRLVMSLPEPMTTKRIQEAMERFYHARARVKLAERFAAMQEKTAYLGLRSATLSLRVLRGRWGSMSHSGRLTLNVMLIRAPTSSIDYVILHELCHLAHDNHGPAFFRLLRRLMPDWESRKIRLERLLA